MSNYYDNSSFEWMYFRLPLLAICIIISDLLICSKKKLASGIFFVPQPEVDFQVLARYLIKIAFDFWLIDGLG